MSNKRLFLDMDGMLAEYRTFVSEEQYLQEGYYISLSPHINVIEAIKKVIETEPNIEVFTLSAYYNVPGAIAVQEKNAWLDKWLPEVDINHRIYTECGKPKQDFIPGGIDENDYLMDDYTKNLEMWEDGNGKGIKLLNGINSRVGKWDGPKISYKKSADEIAKSIIDVINHGVHIQDKVNEMQLRNETQGLTMFISRDRLAEIVETHFPEYENVDDFRKNFTLEDWRFVRRLEPSAEIKENTSIKQFEFEHNTFKNKFYDKLDMLRRSAIEKQIDNMKLKVQLSFSLSKLERVNRKETTITPDEVIAIQKQEKEIERRINESYNQWKEYKTSSFENLSRSVAEFFGKYENMPVQNPAEFRKTLAESKNKMYADLFMYEAAIKRIDKEELNRLQNYITAIDTICEKQNEKFGFITTTFDNPSIEDEIFADEIRGVNNTTNFDDKEHEEVLD